MFESVWVEAERCLGESARMLGFRLELVHARVPRSDVCLSRMGLHVFGHRTRCLLEHVNDWVVDSRFVVAACRAHGQLRSDKRHRV